MATGVYLLESYVVRAQHDHRLLGFGLLVLDLLAAATLYLGSLSLVSGQSIVELKGKLLLARAGHAASTVE